MHALSWIRWGKMGQINGIWQDRDLAGWDMLAPHQRVGHVTRITLPATDHMIQCPQCQGVIRLLPVAGIASRLNHHWHAGQFRGHGSVESAINKECLQYVRPESANRAGE